MNRCIAVLIAVSVVCGCRSVSSQADTAWLNDFARTDTIELRTETQSRKVTDTDTINRLRQIYNNSRWQVYRVTVPAGIMDRVIYLYDADQQLRRLCYSQSGTLWEFDASDDVRNATINESDRAWLDELFVERNGASGG